VGAYVATAAANWVEFNMDGRRSTDAVDTLPLY
jgi:hypothetical protein